MLQTLAATLAGGFDPATGATTLLAFAELAFACAFAVGGAVGASAPAGEVAVGSGFGPAAGATNLLDFNEATFASAFAVGWAWVPVAGVAVRKRRTPRQSLKRSGSKIVRQGTANNQETTNGSARLMPHRAAVPLMPMRQRPSARYDSNTAGLVYLG